MDTTSTPNRLLCVMEELHKQCWDPEMVELREAVYDYLDSLDRILLSSSMPFVDHYMSVEELKTQYRRRLFSASKKQLKKILK